MPPSTLPALPPFTQRDFRDALAEVRHARRVQVVSLAAMVTAVYIAVKEDL